MKPNILIYMIKQRFYLSNSESAIYPLPKQTTPKEIIWLIKKKLNISFIDSDAILAKLSKHPDFEIPEGWFFQDVTLQRSLLEYTENDLAHLLHLNKMRKFILSSYESFLYETDEPPTLEAYIEEFFSDFEDNSYLLMCLNRFQDKMELLREANLLDVYELELAKIRAKYIS